MKQIWVIFTRLKLCLATATHNFQVGENLNYLIARFTMSKG